MNNTIPVSVAARCIGFLVAATCTAQMHAHAQRGIDGTAPAATASPQKWAVIIGVGDYQDAGLTDLPNAVRDAKALYEMLTSMPDGFPRDNVVVIADTEDERHRPVRGVIIRYLNSFIALTRPGDTLLVYFAGHGQTVDGSLYLLPRDAAVSAVALSGLAFSDLEGMMISAQADKKILILDACHSGTGRSQQTLSEEAEKQFEAARGIVTLASCSANELSHEMPKTGHGAFTHFLLEGLTGNADANNDGFISAPELSLYTWDKTRRWAGQQGLVQNPWKQEEGSGSLLLAKVGGRRRTEEAPGSTSGTVVDGKTRIDAGARFLDNEDGTVLDTATGLLWQKEHSEEALDRQLLTRTSIEAYLRRLNKSELGGRGGWRLPTILELDELRVKDKEASDVFLAGRGRYFWYAGANGRPSGGYDWDRGGPAQRERARNLLDLVMKEVDSFFVKAVADSRQKPAHDQKSGRRELRKRD